MMWVAFLLYLPFYPINRDLSHVIFIDLPIFNQYL